MGWPSSRMSPAISVRGGAAVQKELQELGSAQTGDAVVSLVVIAIYLGFAGAIGMFGLISLEATVERVGPNTVPGFLEPALAGEMVPIWITVRFCKSAVGSLLKSTS